MKHGYDFRENEQFINDSLPHYKDIEESPGYGFILATGSVILGLLVIFAIAVPHIAGLIRDIIG